MLPILIFSVPASIEVHGARLGAHFAPDGDLVIVLSSCYPDIRPANSLLEVKRLIRPEIVVEIEADAIVTTATAG